MKKENRDEKRFWVNGIRCFFITLFLNISVITVFAGSDELYVSSNGLYSFIMPEGFRYFTSIDSLKQDVFVGSEDETFNITYVEDLPFASALLS